MNKGQLARKKILRSKIVGHHLRYTYNGLTHKQDERVVQIYNTEHYITRLLQTRGRYVSKGFLFVLVDFILDRLVTGNFTELKQEIQDENTHTSQSGQEKVEGPPQ